MRFDRSGFTIPEVMISLGVLALIIYSSVALEKMKNPSSTSQVSECREHVTSILEGVARRGVRNDIKHFLATGTEPTYNPAAPGASPAQDQEDVPDATRWAVPVVTFDGSAPGNLPVLRQGTLLDSGVNTLLAVYNSNVDAYCTPDNGAAPPADLQNLVPTGQPQLRDAVTEIRVRPFNIIDGTFAGCLPAPLQLTPPGRQTDDTPESVDNGYASIPMRSDLGLEVRVRTRYRDRTNQMRECTGSQRFQFERDGTGPNNPDIIAVTSNNSYNGAAPLFNCIAENQNSITVNLGYSAANPIKAGAQLVCRDYSERYDRMPGVDDEVPCFSGPTGYTPHPAGLQWRMSAPAPGISSIPDFNGTRTLIGSNRWMPCGEVTLCNTPPAASVINNAYTPTPLITVTYNNLPSDCRMRLQVKAVDTSGNASAVGSDVFFQDAAVDPGLTLVARPTCGYYVGPNPLWAALPQGYYRCN